MGNPGWVTTSSKPRQPAESSLDQREVGLADLDAILTLTNACDIADTGEVDLERSDVAASLAASGTRAWALAGPDLSLQALIWLEVDPNRPSLSAEFFVHPSQPPEIAIPLINAVRQAQQQDAAGRKLHVVVSANAPAKSALLIANGATVVRHFFKMACSLSADVPAVTWPDGTEIVSIADTDEDLRPIHLTLSEAFQDHWEHGSAPYDAWQARHRAREDFDPSLWRLVTVGGEPAAAVVNSARDSGGFVGAIGVRRPYRGLGLARRLLLTSFAAFRERGMTEASLFVDSTNPTGAVRLYESIGMHVAAQWDCHEFPGR
jgi:ribosomal protein S18 acetylase RimI-like enzyme